MSVEHVRFEPPEGLRDGRRALVFSPSMARWDGGRFFTPVTQALLARGVTVTVVDTLSLVDETMADVRALADRWARELPAFGTMDLLCGNALGGAVAQALLSEVRPAAGALLVSAPTRADERLRERLTTIVEPAGRGDLATAVAALHELVQPEDAENIGEPPAVSPDLAADPWPCFRMTRKKLLFGLDLGEDVRSWTGPLLHIVGERSRLVGPNHVLGAGHHVIESVPGAGMRPHWDRRGLVSELVARFVNEKARVR